MTNATHAVWTLIGKPKTIHFDKVYGWLSKRKMTYVITAIHSIVSLARILMERKPSIVYLCYNQGKIGRLISFIIVYVAEIAGHQVVIHHHVYGYIRNSGLLEPISFKGVSSSVFHLSLGQSMTEDLIKNCHIDRNRISSLRNFYAIKTPDVIPSQPNKNIGRTEITFGFISNITIEKGIGEIEWLSSMIDPHDAVRIIIAGGCNNQAVEKMLERLVANKSVNIEWLGPVYGDEKAKFFSKIDCLLFPTLYMNEAQPLVLIEAASYGLPFISYNRGGIVEIANLFKSDAVDTRKQFLDSFNNFIFKAKNSPRELKKQRMSRRSTFIKLREIEIARLCAFFETMQQKLD
tara:strand:+ start:9238 stop:10281 length:1044 start_codon:yes stop_codon:yes gene_type:complete